MKFIKVGSPLLRKLLKNPKFLKRIQEPVKLNFKFDIPYLSGYSKNGKTIYFDRHLKRYWKYKGRVVDVTDFLLVHEFVEKALLDLFKLHYQKAHHIATHIESLACRQHGINWWAYTKFLKPQIKTAEHEKITKVPKDLDLEPYKDEKEKRILAGIQKAGKKINESLTSESKGVINGVWRNVIDRGEINGIN